MKHQETNEDVLLYEIKQLNWTWSQLRRTDKETPKPGTEEHNNVVEGFLLHTRNLLKFFGGVGQDGLDETTKARVKKISKDFEDAVKWVIKNWDTKFEYLDEPVKSITSNITYFLSHITPERLKTKPEWPFNRIGQAINFLMAKYTNIEPDSGYAGLRGYIESVPQRIRRSIMVGCYCHITGKGSWLTKLNNYLEAPNRLISSCFLWASEGSLLFSITSCYFRILEG